MIIPSVFSCLIHWLPEDWFVVVVISRYNKSTTAHHCTIDTRMSQSWSHKAVLEMYIWYMIWLILQGRSWFGSNAVAPNMTNICHMQIIKYQSACWSPLSMNPTPMHNSDFGLMQNIGQDRLFLTLISLNYDKVSFLYSIWLGSLVEISPHSIL